ncbi:PaaI family thioesterase [Reyranella soli]|uniref:Phenylacetic acid degradation protein PaaI n=1 Tax=Reyranella soli TaxID=1230389 RepID=A0A512NBR7_9HYPH|nr:hotdog fold thioesterase [Reyranella soli]GEP56375.1 phenylacetic acid degradation protein PaaI [Reyranella soli]
MKDGKQQPAAIDVFALAARDNFARSLGIEIVEASLGRAVSRVRLEERHINFIGVAHGGLVFTLADAAMGYASNSQGILSPSIDSHILYSLPARAGDVLTATAVEIARTSRLSNYRIDVARGDGKLVAAMTGTTYITGKPVEV